MRGANGTGPAETRINREKDFEVFDRLPEPVRRAMNFTAFKYQATETEIQVRALGADKVAAIYASGAVDALTIRKEQERAAFEARLKGTFRARAA